MQIFSRIDPSTKKGFVGAVAAVVVIGIVVGVGWLGWHLWIDHLAFHNLYNYVGQHAKQIEALPPVK